MLKFSNKQIKKILSITLSLAIMASCLLCGAVNASAAAITATDSHSVYTDDFSDAETMSNWRWAAVGNESYSTLTASIADGKMTFNNTNGSGSFLHGMRFIPDKKFTEQRAEVTFNAQKGLKPCLWVRVNQTYKGNSQSCYGYYLLFNCNQNGNVTLDLAKRIGTASKTIGTISYGTAITEGQEYHLEMVAQGSNPTLISVSLYTDVGSVKDAVVCHDTFIDNEATLQVAGSAGVSAARTSAVTATDVSIEKFEFTSTEKVSGNYYVSEGTTGSKTFGQVVMLDPTKKYVFAATAVDNGLRSGEDVNPLWIEYFNTSNAGTRVLTARNMLKSNRLEADVEGTGLAFDEYFNVYYEFDMSTLTDNKVETGANGKTRVIVGFRNDGSTTTAGKFTNFKLYAKDDVNKTNLIVNPDFKMGLYGWYDEAGSYMNYAQLKESDGVTIKGYATLSSAVNNYEYYNLFKNTGYTVTQGDANRDTKIDIIDLVRTKKIASGSDKYFAAVDYDENGVISALDTIYLKKNLLGFTDDAPEDFVGVETSQKIARLGYRPYDTTCPPEQSLASYRLAYEMGYEILLCDVRTTTDGYFVALHDKTINSYATNSEGNRITNDTPINISDITLAEADTYDFGIYRGEQYEGTKIMRVSEFMELCKELGVCMHLELKETFTEEKLDELVAMVKQNGLEDNIMINGQNGDNLRYVADKLPNAVMGTWVKEITDTLINQIATYGENNPKFIYVSNGGETSINYDNYMKCQEKGIDIGYTEIRSEEELASFKALDILKYCKYVATRYELY